MIRLGIGQIRIVSGNPKHNYKTIIKAMEYASALRTDILVFPELAISGYAIGDLWEQRDFVKECLYYGQKIVDATRKDEITKDMTVIFGNIAVDSSRTQQDGRIRKFNGLYIAQNGQLIRPTTYDLPCFCKTLQPNYRYFNESRHFTSLIDLALENHQNPSTYIEPVTIDVRGKKITLGPLICEDSWDSNYSLSPTDILIKNGKEQNTPVDLIINISSSPFGTRKNSYRHSMFSSLANRIETPILYVNHVGIQNNGKTIFSYDGCSTLYHKDGSILKQVQPFEDTVQPVLLSLDKESPVKISDSFSSNTSTNHNSNNTNYDSIHNNSFITVQWNHKKFEIPAHLEPIHNIFLAIHQGIRCFLEQFHIKNIVIGASGGIDSALNAALYGTVVKPDQLYLVNMPSQYNSDATKDLAYKLSQNLGSYYAVIPVQESLELTTKQIETITFKKDTQETHLSLSTLGKENVQARDRSSRILSAVASAVGGIFTCNGNKTEFTVGYGTMYGDIAGALAATGDLWKHEVYALSRYINEYIYEREVIPQGSIDIIPSAELSHNQDITKGLGDPIQYDYHDYLFKAFVEERLTPTDILSAYIDGTLESILHLNRPISEFLPTPELFVADLERWWNLFFGLAVAKRLQAPPLIMVSKRAFGSDLLESQLSPYYSERYRVLKEELLFT